LSSSVSYTPRSTSLNRIVKWWIVAAVGPAPAAEPVGEELVLLEFVGRVLRPVGGAGLVGPLDGTASAARPRGDAI
jgi:hypothetical protein